MNGDDSSASVLPKKPGRWRLIAVVVAIALALVGLLAYTTYLNQCHTLVGCPPYPTLSIQDANAQVGSPAPTICQTTQFTATCLVQIAGQHSGEVTLNAAYNVPRAGTSIGGTAVAFLVYASAASYINFTSIPGCAFTSAPSLDTRGCNIPSNSSVEFQFNFTVSSNYVGSSRGSWPDSVTVYMWQTCCLP